MPDEFGNEIEYKVYLDDLLYGEVWYDKNLGKWSTFCRGNPFTVHDHREPAIHTLLESVEPRDRQKIRVYQLADVGTLTDASGYGSGI